MYIKTLKYVNEMKVKNCTNQLNKTLAWIRVPYG